MELDRSMAIMIAIPSREIFDVASGVCGRASAIAAKAIETHINTVGTNVALARNDFGRS